MNAIQKILLITEKPNTQAYHLIHDELFDYEKNSFSQFFARVIFGNEVNINNYFNSKNILWMHAKGSNCHGSHDADGSLAILKTIREQTFSLIIIFGAKAFGILSGKKFLEAIKIYANMCIERNDLLRTDDIKEIFKGELCTKEFRNQYIVIFPHVSGQAQSFWMKDSMKLSLMVNLVQKRIFDILNISGGINK